MGCPNIYVIALTVCFGMGLCLTQGIQPNTKAKYSVTTILSEMNTELTSPFGNCSFPPKEVLNPVDQGHNTFEFLDTCERRMPSLDTTKPVSDPGIIMCLGLLELGHRLCSLEKNYFKSGALFSLPHDADSFNSLVVILKEHNDSNLCTNLKKGLKLVSDEHNLSLGALKKWSLQSVFHEREESCSRICFDYANHPQLLCKLILWGISNVLVQPSPQPFQSLISHNAKVSVDLNPSESSLVSQGEPDKTEEGTSFNHNVPDEQKSDDVFSERINNFNTGTSNGNIIASSSEITPIDEAKNDHTPVENKVSEVRNEDTDAKQSTGSTKSVQNQNEPSPALTSVDGMKQPGSVAEPSTTNNKQDVIKENPEKSLSKPDIAPVDGDNSKDIVFEQKPSILPAEKMPSDIAGNGDELRYSFNSPANQDDEDDDVNFSEEQDQNLMNRESTGFKTDTVKKYSQNEFSNANTFIEERFEDSEDSHFFSYFMAMVVLCIVGYVVFHNKQKILALALEGRSRRTTRRRPTTANYHKLDNNLEEAVSSPCSTSVTHVIY